MFSSRSPSSALHVPTVVFSTVLMELREGPRSPAMLLKTLVSNLPGGPRMAKKLLRKVDTTFAVLSGIGLIKPYVLLPPLRFALQAQGAELSRKAMSYRV